MTFAEVQILSEQVGAAGRAITNPARSAIRVSPSGVVPVNPVRPSPRTAIAAYAESSDVGPTSTPSSATALRSPIPVATADYYLKSGTGSEMSAVGSDTSIPTPGWASAAGSILDEAALASDPRMRNCHLFFTPGHFLMDCPLLGAETKQAAQKKREQQSLDSPARRISSPQAPMRFLKRPTGPPRYGEPRRASNHAYSVEEMQDYPEGATPRAVPESAENSVGEA